MELVIGVYGASGFGKEVYPLVRAQYGSLAKIFFIDDGKAGSVVNGANVYDYEGFKALSGQKQVVIAIANSKVRELLASKLQQDGIAQADIKAQNVVIFDEAEMGQGSLLCPFVTLTSNIKIGKGFHANIYSYVAHDCVIGDYVTFAPSVKCNGNVHIHKHAYIGTGAILKQGTPDKPLIIGEGAVVGMGAVVTKDVPAGAVVVGNPAKPLVK